LLAITSNLNAVHQNPIQFLNNNFAKDLNWQLQATLSQNVSGAREGSSVALSADGNTLAVGACSFNNTGAVLIYELVDTIWQYQATLSQNIADGAEGNSVALSGDGSILAASENLSLAGAQIYIRSNNAWQHLTTLNYVDNNITAVALSADGSTLAAGVPGLNGIYGGIFIFVQSNNTWHRQATLTQNQEYSSEGSSVALSADGNTLAAGASEYGDLCGATQIYVRSGKIWAHQRTLSRRSSQAYEGISVALSADGNTLAAGAEMLNAAGATVIYIRSGISWEHLATLSQNILGAYEGNAVALSTDGNILAAGANRLDSGAGAVNIYTRTNNNWQYQDTLSQKIAAGYEGSSVALSANGTTLAAGTPYSSNATGEIFVYAQEN